jgi:hypothetical protein
MLMSILHKRRQRNLSLMRLQMNFGKTISFSDAWLVDSGASRHITGYQDSLRYLTEKDSTLHVELGNNAKYAVKGVGTTLFQVDFGDSLHMRDVLFVPGLWKNLLSISALDNRGSRVALVDGQVLVCLKGSSIESAGVTSVREGGLYRLSGHPAQALVHDNIILGWLLVLCDIY